MSVLNRMLWTLSFCTVMLIKCHLQVQVKKLLDLQRSKIWQRTWSLGLICCSPPLVVCLFPEQYPSAPLALLLKGDLRHVISNIPLHDSYLAWLFIAACCFSIKALRSKSHLLLKHFSLILRHHSQSQRSRV